MWCGAQLDWRGDWTQWRSLYELLRFSDWVQKSTYLRALQTKPPKEVSFLIKPVCMHAMLLQSCLTLCNPVDCSLPSSFVYGVLEAGILEWDAVSSSRGSSWSKGWTYLGIKPATFLPSLPVLCVWKSVSYYYIWEASKDVTEQQLDLIIMWSWTSCLLIGEGNGNPLQYPCLENPMDGGTW